VQTNYKIFRPDYIGYNQSRLLTENPNVR